MAGKHELTAKQREELLAVLETRFAKHPDRHPGLAWAAVRARLDARPAALWSLHEMERTGGEPDGIGSDAATGACIFCDCAAESPSGRRSLCYDAAALAARKENKPAGSALALAAAMGVEVLGEADYRDLQKLGTFDCKTSSWLLTPERIRKRGGAIFGDRRYDEVFTYHNGADSYYAARGFRASLRV